MGRNSKYNEATETFSVKVPVSQKPFITKMVDDYLKQFLRNVEESVKPISFKVKFKNDNKKRLDELNQTLSKASTKVILDGNVLAVFNGDCGCYLDGTILKRAKDSKCKKTKSQHNF